MFSLQIQGEMEEDRAEEDFATVVKLEPEEFESEAEVDTKSWTDGSDFLPAGWRYKTVHGSTADYCKVMTPDGVVFNSKVKALTFMIDNSYSDEDINKMRSSFLYDGWSESNLLPDQWRYRKCKSERNEYNFISPSGDVFTSRRSLIEYFRSCDEFTDEDVQNALTFIDEIKATWVNNLQDYEENDETVPPGWKIKYFLGVKANRETRHRCYIISPSGARFQSRSKALQFMIQNDHQADHIAHMLAQLKLEGWRSYASLPDNWRIKKKDYVKSMGSHVFTSEGLILTVKRAVEHMERHPEKYTLEQAVSLEELARALTKEKSEERRSWTDSDTTPLGWGYRTVSVKGTPHSREFFLTEHGMTIRGRVKAIQHLQGEGRGPGDEQVHRMRAGLAGVGWQEAESFLPAGWLQKQILGEETKFRYLSPDYTEFRSLVDVYQHMKTNSYSREVVSRVGERLDLKSKLRNKTLSKNTSNWSTHKWQVADFLPPNWKFAEKFLKYGQKKYIYLSPTGFMLKKSVEALLLMIEEQVEQKFLTIMAERLQFDDWKTHSSLPSGWRYCSNRKSFPDSLTEMKESPVVFCSEKPRVMSHSEAVRHLRDSHDMSERELDEMLSALEEEEDDDWKTDDRLPEDWLIKEIVLADNKIFRVKSPDETIFDSVMAAFASMVQQPHLYSTSVLDNVKIKLREEGFEENSSLPRGWMMIKSRGDNLFELLSKEGVLYQTLDEAVNHLRSTGDYSQAEEEKLEELCLSLVEEYLSSKMTTTKGKRKGKVKTSFIEESKKNKRMKKSQNLAIGSD